MRICEAFYPALHCLEITLRNSLDLQIGTYLQNPDWLVTAPTFLVPNQLRNLNEVHADLQRRRVPLDQDRIVSELTFGFWTSFLVRHYDSHIWPQLLKPVFSGCPKHFRRRSTIERRINDIRKFRNRIFHHEKVLDRPSIVQDYEDVLEAIGWCCPEMKQLVEKIDGFYDVSYGGYHTRICQALDEL